MINLNQASQQLHHCEQMIHQLMQQTQQASQLYQQMLQQEQQNAKQLEQLAQREQQAVQMIQQTLQGHQSAIQQMQHVSSICHQLEQSLQNQTAAGNFSFQAQPAHNPISGAAAQPIHSGMNQSTQSMTGMQQRNFQ